MLILNQDPRIKGFTTNPTLCRKAGITDYSSFAKSLLAEVKDKPISFEVFADDFGEMERQGLEIAGWAPNAVVKIPITNTRGEFAGTVIERLAISGVTVNVTAVMTWLQVVRALECLDGAAGYVSVFAGRIADTGKDPVDLMRWIVEYAADEAPSASIIWASPREVLNYYQAEQIGCHVITMTPDLIGKLSLNHKSLREYSLDTVKMFYEDGKGFSL
jgi:transaldolase